MNAAMRVKDAFARLCVLLAVAGLAACVKVEGNAAGRGPSGSGGNLPGGLGGAGGDGRAQVDSGDGAGNASEAGENDAPGDGADTPAEAGTDAGVPGVSPDAGDRRTIACHPRPVRVVAADHFQELHTPAPTCEIDESGVMSMSYATFEGCPVFIDDGKPSGDYRACYFGQNEDVSDFERGLGRFQVTFCFDGPLFEDLNMWFDTGAPPSTPLRLMRLVRGDDTTPRSCRTAILSLQESCASAFATPNCGLKCSDAIPDAGAEEVGVRSNSDAEAPDVGSPDGVDGDSDGGQGAPTPTACSVFERVKVRVTTEYCQCPTAGCVRPATANVSVLSLVYYPESCLCDRDSDCGAGTFCRKDAVPADAPCWTTGDGCRGICAP